MAEMNRRFGSDNFDPNAHWLPAAVPSWQNCFPPGYNNAMESDDELCDTAETELDYEHKVSEFETTVQEKLKEEELIFVRKWTDAGLQVVALITEHLVSHPFLVLRRQCQVNNKLSRYHVVPVTLIPVIVNMHRWQGITCLWKGVGSVLVIKGLTLAVEDLISKITFWPKEVTLKSSGKSIGKHVMLKYLTCAIVTPFYSASLLETVQSEIACERPEFLDVFKEGLRRLIDFGYPHKGRMLTVWSLILPTAVYFIVKHFFTLFVKSVISTALIIRQDRQHRRQGAIPKDIFTEDEKNIELSSSLIAVLSADILLFPLETILHRLHLQGTRTIIDDLDNGLSVTPILTNFEDVVDCYNTTVRKEGYAGLYKGFGALIMKYLTYTSVIKLSKFVFTQVTYMFCKSGNSYPISKSSNWDKRREVEVKNKNSEKHKKKRQELFYRDVPPVSDYIDYPFENY